MHRLLSSIVWFFALSLPASAAAEQFTVVALPDTQKYSASYPATFERQIDWILANRIDRNIVFVGQVGDLVDAGTEQQWSTATRAMHKLDSVPELPWGTLPGNHDWSQDHAMFLRFFGPNTFKGKPWYGGGYDASSYVFFSGNGRRFLALMLQYQAPGDVAAWAQRVLDAHPDLPTIVFTHDYLTEGGRTEYGEKLWRGIVSTNRQVFAVMCGHMHHEYHQVSTNAFGEPVLELLADFQDEPDGGGGYLRLYTFDDEARELRVATYSPITDASKADADSAFALRLDLDRRSPTPDAGSPTPPPAASANPSGFVVLIGGAIILIGGSFLLGRRAAHRAP